MEQSPPLEANSRSTPQELRVRYHVYHTKFTQLVPFLSHINRVHILLIFYPKIYFNTILPSTLVSA
jgi:hypothetical protein